VGVADGLVVVEDLEVEEDDEDDLEVEEDEEEMVELDVECEEELEVEDTVVVGGGAVPEASP